MRGPPRDEFARIALGALSELYNVARRLTGNEHDAEDLVQETYLQAFAHADQLRSLANCKTWLFRIMRNRFISLHRARKARPELVLLEGGLEEAPLVVEAALHLQRSAIGRFSREAIAKALRRLPEELRTAVTMCDIEGFSYKEIAEIIGCPAGTVRSRIARGRAYLAGALVSEAAAFGLGKGRNQ